MQVLNSRKIFENDHNLKLIIAICGIFIAFIGGLIFILWILGYYDSFDPNQKFIPMADETALLFFIFGSCLAVYPKSLDRPKLARYLTIFIILIILLSGFALFDSALGLNNNFNNFFGRKFVVINQIPTGIMSFLTSICFILIAVAFLFIMNNGKKISVVFSSISLFIGYIVIAGYAYDVPIFYGGKTVPMARLTSILFIISSFGLYLAAGSKTYPIKCIIGDSVRDKLFRILIPAIFVLSQIQGYFLSHYVGQYGSSFALINSISSICLLFISGAVVIPISRSLGTTIDRNLNARKIAEDALRESEENFRSIFENNSTAMALIEPNQTVSLINDEYCAMSGFTKDEIIGKSWISLIVSLNYDQFGESNLIGQMNQPNAQVKYEYTFYHKNGNERRGLLSLSLLSNRKLIASSIDITERKLVEQELINAKDRSEQSEKQLILRNTELVKSNTFIQTILDNLPIGLALNRIDNGDAMYMNKKFEEIYGWKLEEITSISSFFEHVYPKAAYRNEIAGKIMSDIASGDPTRLHWENIEVTGKKGDQRIVDAVNISLIEQNTMVSTVMDVTSLHQIQRDLQAEKEHAEESDRLKSAFLANMSHEIRTPMNGILGFSELLKEPKLTTEEQREYIAIIEKSGKRMLNIINDIVDISKIESGQMTINIVETNVNNQVEYIYTFFKPEVEEKGMQLLPSFGLPGDKSIVQTDQEKVFAILTNLVKNAIKYSDMGTIEFGYELKGEYLEFYVKDQGIGVPKERQKAIFERFIQADISDVRAFQGAGLGLAITKTYVEMLGGRIWMESEPGEGSIFYFTLPYSIDS